MAQDRSNIRAGIATLGTVAAASLLLWGAIEWHASRRIGYTVRFTREQGVYGLKPGAPLLVGGMPRGSVVGVEPEIAGGAVTAYLVRVEIDPEVPVSARTRISAQAMDVSGDAVLVAEGVSLLARNPLIGPGGATSGTLPEDSVIGASDPDEFGAWGGAASSASMRSLYRSWFAETAPAQGLAERLRGSFADFEAKARPLARDAKALGEDLSSDLATWRDDFKALREAAVDAFARLGASEGAANDAVVPALKELGEDI